MLAIIRAAPLPALLHQKDMRPQADAFRATSKAVAQWMASQDDFPDTCRSGLWLLAGELERCHEICQAIHSPEGSYWHAIMHRTEGDFENAKYWLRRVGKHAVHESLCAKIAPLQTRDPSCDLSWSELLDPSRVAYALVDCVRSGRSEQLQQIAWIEWQLLFRHSIVQAIGLSS